MPLAQEPALNMLHNRIDKAEHDALMAELAPLPVHGRSWPKPIGVLACIITFVIGFQLISTATTDSGQMASPYMIGAIVLSFIGLCVITWYMLLGHTTVSEKGIQQQWILRREITWDELRFAKFVPLLYSKRLICFPVRGRPVIFQGGTKELQVAFARISLVYKRGI